MKYAPAVALAASLLGTCTVVEAQTDTYHVTPQEKAACESDVGLLCSDIERTEDALLVCMRAKKAQLSPGCLSVLTAGLRKRHLPPL